MFAQFNQFLTVVEAGLGGGFGLGEEVGGAVGEFALQGGVERFVGQDGLVDAVAGFAVGRRGASGGEMKMSSALVAASRLLGWKMHTSEIWRGKVCVAQQPSRARNAYAAAWWTSEANQ